MRQQHLVGEPGERGGEAGIDRGRHGVNIIMDEKWTVSSSPRTGTWKGAGRRWRVLMGLEGVAGCSKGRRGRNVRQRAVTSSATPVKCSAHFFWHLCRILHRDADVAAMQAAETGAAGGRQLTHSWTPRTAHERLKAAIWQAPGPSPPLGHYPPEPLQNTLAHTGCRRCSAWDGPAGQTPR